MEQKVELRSTGQPRAAVPTWHPVGWRALRLEHLTSTER